MPVLLSLTWVSHPKPTECGRLVGPCKTTWIKAKTPRPGKARTAHAVWLERQIPESLLNLTVMANETNLKSAPDAGQTQAPDYENKRQLAARLAVSVRTIDNLLTRGLPHVKLTRKLTRFPRAAVDGWLAQRQIRRA